MANKTLNKMGYKTFLSFSLNENKNTSANSKFMKINLGGFFVAQFTRVSFGKLLIGQEFINSITITFSKSY